VESGPKFLSFPFLRLDLRERRQASHVSITFRKNSHVATDSRLGVGFRRRWRVYGHSRWGHGGGAGIGLGTILLILLVAYLLGVFH
jgi:hypothetical protein